MVLPAEVHGQGAPLAKFKNDWEECKDRLDAFWEGEIVDRCCTGVVASRASPLPTP